MPAGLDGNPNPVVSSQRNAVLDAVARAVAERHMTVGRLLVAIDGRSGAGKSTFADELTALLRERNANVVRSTTDSFHHPRARRLQRGPRSPEGYYLDSHQLGTISSELLGPFANRSTEIRVAAFDEPSDTEVIECRAVPPRSVLVFDGLFLQRAELREFWDLTVYLSADDRLDQRWLNFLSADLPTSPTERAATIDRRLAKARWPRYREGWYLYLEKDSPLERADIVVENSDLANPRIIR